MIKAISFDLYNTLVQFWPPLDEVQQAACQELGLNVCKTAIRKGYAVADVYFNEENGRHSLGLRSAEERLDFFARYEQMILENAGVPVSLALAKQIWTMAMTIPKDLFPSMTPSRHWNGCEPRVTAWASCPTCGGTWTNFARK